ncbi:MAG: BamA/TamA family outer membrane protein [Candidatus Eisenbacteria bacterium]
MRSLPIVVFLLAALLAPPFACSAASASAPPASPAAAPDTLEFAPAPADSGAFLPEAEPHHASEADAWMRAPFGEGLLTDRELWRARGGRFHSAHLLLDYNRVDRLRLGVRHQIQVPEPMAPRLGVRVAYAFGRERVLYGFQLEQPLVRPGRIALGASLVRRTDHNELQQVDDLENTLAMLLWRYDYRDYFERDGLGAYLSWYVPDFSTLSVHLRRDQYRSLPLDPGTRSWFHRSRPLRDNPAVDEGETHSAVIRLERAAHARRHTHAGVHHWFEAERAGRGLGGDFTYTRVLGDLRSVIRLSPATTLMLRVAGGHTASGTLPVQKEFPLGGVDVLRAHAFGQFRGDQMALAQAEYTVGLWRLRTGGFEGGLHAIAFVDAGQAWFDARHRWDLRRQHVAVDGGFGLATGEDNLRVYLAKDLQASDSDLVLSVRLHRPF